MTTPPGGLLVAFSCLLGAGLLRQKGEADLLRYVSSGPSLECLHPLELGAGIRTLILCAKNPSQPLLQRIKTCLRQETNATNQPGPSPESRTAVSFGLPGLLPLVGHLR